MLRIAAFLAIVCGIALISTRAFNPWDLISGAAFRKPVSSSPKLSPAAQALVDEALKGIPYIYDSHIHVVCREEKNGCFVHDSLFSPFRHPLKTAKAKVLMSALGMDNGKRSDVVVERRTAELINKFPSISYHGFMFAFAASYTKGSATPQLEHMGLKVSNSYMLRTVENLDPRGIAVASLHPFEPDLEKKFAELHGQGVRFLKLLPNSMHVPVADSACEKFFALISRYQMVLITHAGDEHSVDGGGVDNSLGNPLLYRLWLKKYPQLRIIFAHVGSEGVSKVSEESIENYTLVVQMLREFPLQTFADLSSLAAAPPRVEYIARILSAKDLHSRLLYGSDYPIAAIKSLVHISLLLMYHYELLGDWQKYRQTAKLISEIFDHNPLLAAFVILRTVQYQGAKFPARVFYQNTEQLLATFH